CEPVRHGPRLTVRVSSPAEPPAQLTTDRDPERLVHIDELGVDHLGPCGPQLSGVVRTRDRDPDLSLGGPESLPDGGPSLLGPLTGGGDRVNLLGCRGGPLTLRLGGP